MMCVRGHSADFGAGWDGKGWGREAAVLTLLNGQRWPCPQPWVSESCSGQLHVGRPQVTPSIYLGREGWESQPMR